MVDSVRVHSAVAVRVWAELDRREPGRAAETLRKAGRGSGDGTEQITAFPQSISAKYTIVSPDGLIIGGAG